MSNEHHIVRFSGHHARSHVINNTGVAKRQTEDCNLYLLPAEGAKVDVLKPFAVSWDTSCNPPTTQGVDIYISLDGENIHTLKNVNWSKGSYDVQIDPSLYGYKPEVVLRASIQEHTILPFGFDNKLSPPFTGTIPSDVASSLSSSASLAASTATASGASPQESTPRSRIEWVNNFFKEGMTKGQIAAAVIMPILAIAAFLVAYIVWSRKKEANKRMHWKEKVDQRMSTLSVDWRATTGAGGAAAVRHSIAMSMAERRASSFYTRPTSTFDNVRPTHPYSAQARTSRISFAEDNYRDSTADIVPAVPKLPTAYQKTTLERQTIMDDESPQSLSPTQRQGAFVLDDDSIRDRLSATSAQKDARPSMDERDLQRDLSIEPAIAMMRAGNKPADNEVLFDEPVTPITPLAPAVTRDTSSQRAYNMPAYSMTSEGSSYFTNTPVTSSDGANPVASDPDEALRAYAARAAAHTQPTQVTSTPFAGFAAGPALATAAGLDLSSPDTVFRSYAQSRNGSTPQLNVNPQNTGNVMRTLYGPNSGMTQGLGMTATVGSNNPYRDSYADGSIGKAQ